jgi:uncharacterized membrane protein
VSPAYLRYCSIALTVELIAVETIFANIASGIALGVELSAAFLIAAGALQAFVIGVPALIGRPGLPKARRNAWRKFARWLLLALEFELGADIVRSAIAPTWNDIGQLAAIAVIRTFLNYFLERDLETLGEPGAD